MRQERSWLGWHAQNEVMGVVCQGVLRLPSEARAVLSGVERWSRIHHALRLGLRDVPPGRCLAGRATLGLAGHPRQCGWHGWHAQNEVMGVVSATPGIYPCDGRDSGTRIPQDAPALNALESRLRGTVRLTK